MSSRTIHSLSDLQKWVEEFGTQLPERSLLLLEGPMGVGKTQLVKYLVEARGGEGTSSPSFAIHQVYATPQGEIDHLDLFRLESDDELESVGFWDLFSKETGLIVVEWAERVQDVKWNQGWKVLRVQMEMQGPAGPASPRQLNWQWL